MRDWQILARHKWVAHATVTESYRERANMRRFTATIHGWRNFKIWEGPSEQMNPQAVITRVRELRDQIEKGDNRVWTT